ncbi:MAG: HK97-gp10 family putative phage morphogenesis protein [Planctomycetota bacterium]
MSTSKSMVVTFAGDKELEAAFNALALGAQKKVFRPALRAGGKVILAAIKARVPRKTGNLRKSIKLRASRRSRKRIGVAVFVDKGILAPRPTPKRANPGRKEWWHPAHLELGYVRKTKTGTFVVPPQSFIRAGFDSVKEQAMAAIEAEVGRRMDLIYAKPKAAETLDEGAD